MERGRSNGHGVVNHYSLSRPEIEDLRSDRDGDRVFGQSKQSRRLSEFNAGLPRENPTSSKFEWKKLLPQHKELGGAGNYGITATTVTNDGICRFSKPSQIGIALPNMPVYMEPDREPEPERERLSGGPRDSGSVITDGSFRFSNSSQFGTKLPQIPLSVEQEIGRFSGPCNLDVGAPQHSRNMYGCSNALPSRILTGDSVMVREFLSQTTQNQAQLDSLEVYYEAASVYAKLGSQLKDFEMALKNDAIRGSFNEGLHVPSYGSGFSPDCVGLSGVGVRSIESHVDPPCMRSSDVKSNPLVDPLSMRSSDMKSNPLVDPPGMRSSDMKSNPLVGPHSMRSSDRRISSLEDFSSDEGKPVDYLSADDRKMARGIICKMYDKFYVNIAGPEEKHAGPALVRASIDDQTADRVDECSPRVQLKSTRLGDHVSPLKKQLNAHCVPASGSMHPVVKEREDKGPGSTLLKDRDACLDGANGRFEQQIERERSEILPMAKSDSCFDGVDGSLEQQQLQLPTGDSLGNLLKRKDGNGDSQQAAEDEQLLVVLKKARFSLLQDENVVKSSNETACQMTVNADNHVSQLFKSRGIDFGDISKCLEISPQMIIATKSSLIKQSPSAEKPLIPSPQEKDATHSSVKSPSLDDPDGGDDPDGAHGQGDSLEDNSSLAKIEQPRITPSQMKNQMAAKFTKRSQDDLNGGHNQVVDSSKDNTTPEKSRPPHVPPPKVKSHIPCNFNTGSKNTLDGTPCQEGNFINGNTRVKIEPPHVPPRPVKKKKVGKFTKRSPDGYSKERNATPAQTEPPHRLGPRVGKKKDGVITKRFGDALVSSNDKATPAKRETFHAHSTVVNNQEPEKLSRADPNRAHAQKGDSLDGNVNLVKTVPLENSKDFKQRVQCAFLKFVKQLNESTEWRNFWEQGKAGDLKCNVCGRKSEEFVDMKSLVRHAFTSPTVDRRALHLGFHKALCLMMGWRSAISFNNSWICELLPDAEASALKEDLIIWPPVVIIHNNSVQNINPDERVVLTTEMVEALLKDMGFGEKTKVSWGKAGDQSVILAKFSGTLSGFQEAERLESFYIEKSHGRVEYHQHFGDGKNCIARDSNSNAPADKLEKVVYGYIGIAEDLDKLDLETKKRCFVKSKKEIQNIIADAF